MEVVCISDTHGAEKDITKYNEIPDGDILLHTGDFQSYGKDIELSYFNEWLGTLPHKHKIVIAGNHDKTAWLSTKENVKTLFSNAMYLQDEEVVIEGIKIYGSPWTPTFYNWYFMLERGSDEIKKKWAKIPENTDILLTHGPPMYILDWTLHNNNHMGCVDLRDRVKEVKPRYHVFGHNHVSGYTHNEHTYFINAAVCNDQYIPCKEINTFSIEKRM